MTTQMPSLRIGFATLALTAALATSTGQATAETPARHIGTETSSGSTGSGSSSGSGSYFLDRLATYLGSGSSSCPPWAIVCGGIG
ncbi:hypothetical protein [Nocardia sp. NPDC006630]|uniref:hypothetical protein n=1 Tax=Nocardia sp. NPDC006630 TaxID=3157181 RepID=UPI0033B8412A